MKNLKKVLALVMACAMLFTMSSFAFTDVAEDASYLEAVTMLSKLGIINGYEDGTFLPDNTITRAEAAKVLVCALNAAEQAEGMAEDNIFTDVPGSHWAAGYVNYAANYGVIAGRGNGIFDPEAPVTYEEIVKMVVAMLGYTPVANIKGGYPTGYLYVANNMIKITKGATGVSGDAAKRWVVARLLFNALEAKIMEQDVWSASDPEYVQGDQTLLKDYLEVTKVEGVVTGTFFEDEIIDKEEDQMITIDITVVDGLKGEDLEDSDYAYLEGEQQFEVNGTGAELYFGYTVSAYIKNIDEEAELVAVAPKANKNSTLEIAFDLIEADSWDDSNSKYFVFEYYVDADAEKTTKVKLAKEITDKQDEVLYYENAVEGDLADFIADIEAVYGADCDVDGALSLLDKDGNGVYDYVFVETTSTEFAVKTINEKNYRVTSKGGSSKILDPEADDYYVTFVKDGAIASFEDIAEDDILTIVELYDGNVLKVYISSETVEGRVTSANATTNKYKIAGNIYAKSTGADSISKGDEGIFFLNYAGKIAYAEAVKVTGGDYAFVLGVNTREPIFGAPIYTILMMNAKGEWIQAELAEKVAFYAWDDSEGSFKKNSIELEDGIADIADYTNEWFDEVDDALAMGDALKANRVIKYTLNSAGEISAITIPTDEEDASEEDFTIGAALEDAEYNANRNRFAGLGKTAVGENTVIFTVDVKLTEDEEAAVAEGASIIEYADKKKEVSVATADLFKDEETYTGITFDIADNTFGAMIITSSEASIKEDAPLLVVKDIYEEENEDEEAFLVIVGYMEGEEVTLETVADTDLTSAFEVNDEDFYESYDDDKYVDGAVFEIAQNEEGLVTDINIVYTADAGFFANEDNYDVEDEDGIAYYAGILIDEELDGTYTNLGDLELEVYGEIDVKNARFVSVDLTRKNAKFSVEDSIEGFLDTLITDGEDDEREVDVETMADEEVKYCFAFAKVVDGYAIDVVIYTVVFEALI